MSLLTAFSKLKGRSRAELTERSAQWLTARAERWGIMGGHELHRRALERSLQATALGGEASFSRWLERFREGAVTPFFAGLTDREATVRALRELVPQAEHELLARTERLLTGEFDLLGVKGIRCPLPIDWQRDPIAGIRAPKVHWSRIDYLDPAVAGDHKAVWEINRHQALVSLGQAYFYTGDERWAAHALAWLDAWMDANRPKVGVNWASSLEIAFRSMAWLWTLQLLRHSPQLTAERFSRVIGFLVLCARHLDRYLSTYFSPNTHLTGEALGLYVLGTQLGPLREAARWRSRGLAILLEQLPRHVRADGVYFEQATYYQRYTADFYLHLLILAERCGDQASEQVQPIVVKLLEFLQAVQRPDGSIPLIGDDDGGRLLALDGRGGEDIRAAMAVAATLFGNSEFAFGAQGPSAELVWLLGPAGADRWRKLKPRAPSYGSRAFVSGGVYVMRDRWTANASLMVIDCGPHGIFNGGHAHADALAFDLTVDGVPVLVDPGTFTYTTDPRWRNHFRSSLAHNTVSINGASSSQMHGPFTWRSMATSTLERWHAAAAIDYFEGTHEGFERSPFHAETIRRVLYAKGGYWIVRDEVTAPAAVDVTATLQCAAGLSLRPDGAEGFVVSSTTRDVLQLRVLGPDVHATVEAGWVSPAYGVKVEAPRLHVRMRSARHAVWDTVLSASALNAQVSRRHEGTGDIIEVRHGEFVDRTIFCDGNEHASMEGVDTDADVFFVRRMLHTGEPREVFASGATRLAVDGIVVATSPVPGVFSAARVPTGEWRRRRVGANATALDDDDTLGAGFHGHGRPAGDDATTPSVEVPYYSG